MQGSDDVAPISAVHLGHSLVMQVPPVRIRSTLMDAATSINEEGRNTHGNITNPARRR